MKIVEVSSNVGYHGSPHKFTKFTTTDIFLAKDVNEAKRYGMYIYKVEFVGKPKFETSTIMVVTKEQVSGIYQIEYNKDQHIYRT